MADEHAQATETLAVQLTRMEGKFDTLSMQVGYLVPRVDRHEVAIGSLEMKVQRLGDEAASRDMTVVATAKALREAKEQADAMARAEAAKSESSWTPAQRLITATLAVIGVVGFVWGLLQGMPG